MIRIVNIYVYAFIYRYVCVYTYIKIFADKIIWSIYQLIWIILKQRTQRLINSIKYRSWKAINNLTENSRHRSRCPQNQRSILSFLDLKYYSYSFPTACKWVSRARQSSQRFVQLRRWIPNSIDTMSKKREREKGGR